MRELTVLIPCRNDETGKRYAPGDVVAEGVDFTAAQVEAFLATWPPVLDPLSADEEEE